jgi:hypothetical protein
MVNISISLTEITGPSCNLYCNFHIQTREIPMEFAKLILNEQTIITFIGFPRQFLEQLLGFIKTVPFF